VARRKRRYTTGPRTDPIGEWSRQRAASYVSIGASLDALDSVGDVRFDSIAHSLGGVGRECKPEDAVPPVDDSDAVGVEDDRAVEVGKQLREVGERLGKSRKWVSDRVKVALNLKPEVKGLVEEGDLSYTLARVVTTVEEDRQLEFAKLLIEQDITDETFANELADRFDNDTVYTIGYEGRSFDEFLALLEENDIEILVDVRESTSSNYKPEFNGEVLSDRLEENGIDYRHIPELGVKGLIRRPYKDGAISHECFEDWYQWWVTEESGLDLEEFVNELELEGRPAFMCIERYAGPNNDQEIHCHRDHLADMVQSMEIDGRTHFPQRTDLV